MKIQIKDDINGKLSLTDKDFVASGGEGSVYRSGKVAYKIYHDQKKSIHHDKIKELSALNSPNILGPRSVVRDLKSQNPIGFSMPFALETQSICRLFTKTYRDLNSFSDTDSINLVNEIQRVVSFVHEKKCLVVDLNEYSILVDKDHKIPYFIDVDSWQTPNFKATALMESVRDRKVVNNNFTEYSDWFSWGIVMVQLYLGIHPYRGMHPDFLPKKWNERMEKNISIFDKKSSLPSSCREFNVIPKRHFDWFVDTFQNGNRSIPPYSGDIQPIVVKEQPVLINSNEHFNTSIVQKYNENIISLFNFGSSQYVITKNSLFLNNSKNKIMEFKKNKKRLVFNSGIGDAFLASYGNGILKIEEISNSSNKFELDIDGVNDILIRNGNLFSIIGDKLMEHKFIKGKRIFHSIKSCGSVMNNSLNVFDGCLFQNLLGEPSFMIPYGDGKIFLKIIKELSGYRIVDAKSEENILIVLAEKLGKLNRFVFVFDNDFQKYSLRISEDVELEPINFTKISNKVCVLYAGNNSIEIFINNNQIKIVDKTPFDSEMRLFNNQNNIFFIHEGEIHKLDLIKR